MKLGAGVCHRVKEACALLTSMSYGCRTPAAWVQL